MSGSKSSVIKQNRKLKKLLGRIARHGPVEARDISPPSRLATVSEVSCLTAQDLPEPALSRTRPLRLRVHHFGRPS